MRGEGSFRQGISSRSEGSPPQLPLPEHLCRVPAESLLQVSILHRYFESTGLTDCPLELVLISDSCQALHLLELVLAALEGCRCPAGCPASHQLYCPAPTLASSQEPSTAALKEPQKQGTIFRVFFSCSVGSE